MHVVLGAGEQAQESKQQLNHTGQEFDRNAMMLTQTNQLELEELYGLDVLGLADNPLNERQPVYSEFKEQLIRSEQGWYETGLSWKGDRRTQSSE